MPAARDGAVSHESGGPWAHQVDHSRLNFTRLPRREAPATGRWCCFLHGLPRVPGGLGAHPSWPVLCCPWAVTARYRRWTFAATLACSDKATRRLRPVIRRAPPGRAKAWLVRAPWARPTRIVWRPRPLAAPWSPWSRWAAYSTPKVNQAAGRGSRWRPPCGCEPRGPPTARPGPPASGLRCSLPS